MEWLLCVHTVIHQGCYLADLFAIMEYTDSDNLFEIFQQNFSACRYFEGQITAISELNAEELPDDSPVRVVEAAEKVHSNVFLPWSCTYGCIFGLLSYFKPFYVFAMR